MSNLDPALFRETLGHYPTGVAVVTGIADDGRPAGMVVGSFNSVSLEPPIIGFFPTADSRSFAYLRTARSFCVNVLAADQLELCRRFVTGKDAKFEGVTWRPGPLGAPILDGALSWIECTFQDVIPAGDHLIVLGLVRQLAVERSTLPLLFFQGAYGKFASDAVTGAPGSDLIQAAHLAGAIRAELDAVGAELGVNCSVLARIGWGGVHVLAVNHSPIANPFPLGHRMPLTPPLGAAFMTRSSTDEIEEWLQRAPRDAQDRRPLFTSVLDRVRERGYSVLAAAPEALRHHREVVSAFEESDRLPRQEREVQAVSSELAELYEPEVVPGQPYDLESIVVPVDPIPDYPTVALRMSGFARSLDSAAIEAAVGALQTVAASAVRQLG